MSQVLGSDSHAASGFQYVALNTELAGQPYQVIAWLTYADSLQERLDSVIGFTVDLGWVRRVYFAEILSQLDPIVNRADDYVTKHTDLDELIMRIRVVLRRARASVDKMRVGLLTIDFKMSTASSGTAPVRLTRREFELLRCLAERRDKVVHRDELLREVWGAHRCDRHYAVGRSNRFATA